jgi:hypothetical protein
MPDTRTRPRKSARKEREKKSRLGLVTAAVLLLIAALFFGMLELSRPHVTGERLRLDTFVDLAERGRIQTAKVLDFDSFVIGVYQRDDGTVVEYNAPYLTGSRERLVDILLGNRIATTVDQQTPKRVAQLAAYLLPAIALVVLFGYLILSSRW